MNLYELSSKQCFLEADKICACPDCPGSVLVLHTQYSLYTSCHENDSSFFHEDSTIKENLGVLEIIKFLKGDIFNFLRYFLLMRWEWEGQGERRRWPGIESIIYLWLLQPERMKKEPIPAVSSSRDALFIMVLYCKNNILNANTLACEVKNIHQRAKTKPSTGTD